MKQTTILAMLAAGAVTASAGVRTAIPAPVPVKPSEPCAGAISYNNAEMLYAYTDYDNFSDNGSGALLRLEYSAWDNFYLAGGASYQDVDGVDMWVLSGGVGAYMALTDNIHLVAEAGALWTSYEREIWVDDGSSAGTGF